MSEHPRFLTDEETVETLYGFLKEGRLGDAIAHLKRAGDEKAVMQRWIGAQCDINNVKGDPNLSEALARPGVDFALQHGFKRSAAVLLHNLFAFHAPHWDEGVDPMVVPGMVEASRRQVALRRELDDPSSFGWALWDLGMSELIAGNVDAALQAFAEAESKHRERSDADGAAWARLFNGKALLRHRPDRAAAGREMMLAAARVIREAGEDWEKAAIPDILASAGLE